MERSGDPPAHIDDVRRWRDLTAELGAAAGVGYWSYDFVTDRLWVSDELAALYGLDPETFTWLEFTERLHPDDLVTPLVRPVPSTPFGRPNEFLFRVRHADGRYRTIRSRSVTLGDGETPLRKVGVHIDMTDDSLLRLAGLHAEDEHLREFTRTAAHDLRSPLRAIGSLVEFIAEDHPDDLPDDVYERLDQIRDRTGRLGRLVSDLLAYAAAEEGAWRERTIDVEEFLCDAVAATDARQNRILVSSPIDEPISVVDRPLATCVRNLVDNACKHNDKPDGMIVVIARREGDWLVVDVTDDGPGIPPELRAAMFDPLRTTDRAKGSGLGLTFVARAVRRHHGRIEVDSDVGVGTTFTLWWPIVARGTAAGPGTA